MIHFPAWVGEPTPCTTRSFSLTIPAYSRWEHARKMIATFPNHPIDIININGAITVRWTDGPMHVTPLTYHHVY